MKKISLLLLTGFCLFAAASCSDDDEETGLGLEINAADTGFEADGGEGGISIASLGEVNAVADKNWIEITSVAADSVHFRVEPNPDVMLRTGKITVTGSGGHEEVTILQKGSYFAMEVPEGGIEISGLGGEERAAALEYIAKGMKVTVEGGESWLTVTHEEGRIVFTGTMNETNESRSTTVTVNAGGKRISVEVIQKVIEWVTLSETWTNITEEGPELIILGNMSAVNGAVKPAEIEEYDPDWSIEEDVDWIIVEYNGEKIRFTVNETGKSRHAEVNIVARGKVVQSISIWQYPVDIWGEYFEGKWIMHSLNNDFMPQTTELTIKKTSESPTSKDFMIIGMDQQFTDKDVAAATWRQEKIHPSLEMMCQDLKTTVTSNGNNQQYALWLVPLSEAMNVVRNINCGWNLEYDRDLEGLVVKPNDYIATTLPDANNGMQFPGFGIIGYNSTLNNYVNFGLGIYFPDPSRNAVWLERVAE